jgi:cytochrome c553
MIGSLLLGVGAIALAFLFLVLGERARRARNGLLRWLGSIVAVLVAILVGAVGGLDLVGVYRLRMPIDRPVSAVKVAATADQASRGEHLAHLCTSCHSSTGNLPLDGATENLLGDVPGSGAASLYPPNLTPAGPLADWSDPEVIRAIREGIDRDGHPLIIMPSETYHALSDADVQALVAYLRSQPPVAHPTPPRQIGVIGIVLIGTGAFPTSVQPPTTQTIIAPPAGPNAQYGRYVVAITGCQRCHGADLAGGRSLPGGDPPNGPNLTQLIPRWTQADFVKTMRTGTDPIGYRVNPHLMPWKEISAAYADDELTALYLYLHGLTPIQRGSP